MCEDLDCHFLAQFEYLVQLDLVLFLCSKLFLQRVHLLGHPHGKNDFAKCTLVQRSQGQVPVMERREVLHGFVLDLLSAMILHRVMLLGLLPLSQ